MTDSSTDQPVELNIKLIGQTALLAYSLAERQGITTEEVIKRALATESFFLKEREAGSLILLQKADKSIKEAVFR